MHFAGGVFGLVGVIFVVLRLHDYGQQLNIGRFDAIAWVILCALVLAYGAANILLARAWWHLLATLDVRPGWGWSWRTYGLSQLAKYVPGNIFHLASRQALGMAATLPGWALAKSALWELGLISGAGALFSLLAMPLLWPGVPLSLAVFVFGMASVLTGAALRRWIAPSTASAMLWQLIFLAISGLVFIGTLAVVTPEPIPFGSLPLLCGAYVSAWLAGFVTPGAPAGIGVRELVLLFLLGGRVEKADLLLAVVLARVVTVCGDLGFFCLASLMNVWIKRRKIATHR